MARLPLSRQVAGFAGWFVLAFATAALGARASITAGPFYRSLERPPWAPPGWLFGPVWTVLYLTMAVAAWAVWRERGWSGARPALALFLAQLAANALWSWLFFAWRLGAWATADIAVLWLLLAGTVVTFWRIRPWAGALLLPYLAWVTFAAALCVSVWQRNPVTLGG
jgi:tryptophan-rich sensory protein